MTITRNPVHLQEGAKRTAFDGEEIEEERELHALIQRALTGNKAKNIPSYRRYIEGVVLGETGVLPPIHLWSETELHVVRYGSSHYAVVPNGEFLLAIDGETQRTAHWQLDEMATPETARRTASSPSPASSTTASAAAVPGSTSMTSTSSPSGPTPAWVCPWTPRTRS